MTIERKIFALLYALLLLAAGMYLPGAAQAAEREVVKTAGVRLAIDAYDDGDTLVIKGAQLELGEEKNDMGDWGMLANLAEPFKLRFENGQRTIPKNAFYDAYLTEVEGADVEEIGAWAFAYAPLEKAVFPKVETFGGNPFIVVGTLYADGLSLNEAAFEVDAAEGIIYNKGRSRIEAHLFTNAATTFKSAAGVTEIADAAFAATKLQHVSLPNVRTVGNEAFIGGSVKTLSMPSAVTVGARAFSQNNRLTSLYLPKAETLGYQAFGACQNLTAAALPNVRTIGQGAFFNNSKLASISMPSVEAIGKNAFASSHSLSVMELGTDVPAVSDDAFANVNKGLRVLLLTPEPGNYTMPAIPGFPLTTLVLRANITRSPVVLFEGDALELSADIEDAAAPFQWTLDRAVIDSATAAAYAKDAIGASDTGLYAMQFVHDGTSYSTAPIGVHFAEPQLLVSPDFRTVEAETRADLAFSLHARFGEREFVISDFDYTSNLDRAGLIIDRDATGTGIRVHGIPSVVGKYQVEVRAHVQGYTEEFTTHAAIEVTESSGGGGETCYNSGSSGCTALSFAGLSLLLLPLALFLRRKR